MEKITAGWSKLSEDAINAARNYFHVAITTIDKEFGQGYAKSNPELVGAFIKAAATECGASMVAKTIQEHAEEIRDNNLPVVQALSDIKDAIRDTEWTEIE